MPRALLSVSDKTGLLPFATGARRPGIRTRLDRRHRPQRSSRRGRAGDRHLGRHGLSRNHGRPGQDAAPGRPWRDPRAPRPGRRHGDAGPPRHRAHRCRRREPVSVRGDGGQSPTSRSVRSSRRSTSAARAWCGRQPRTFRTCWWSSIPRTTSVRLPSSSSRAGRRSSSASISRARRSPTRRRTTRPSRARWRSSRAPSGAGRQLHAIGEPDGRRRRGCR